MSENKIYAAFVKAQAGIDKAMKESTNPHFRSRYADLGNVVDAIKPHLEANGLAFLQKFHDCEKGIKIETIILHESGETLSNGILFIPTGKPDAQGFGSACTYARRYSLQSAFGVAPDDDDGNAASQPKPQQQRPQMAQQQQASSAAPATGDVAEQLQSAQDMKTLVGIFNALDNDQKREFKPTFDAMRSSLAAA